MFDPSAKSTMHKWLGFTLEGLREMGNECWTQIAFQGLVLEICVKSIIWWYPAVSTDPGKVILRMQNAVLLFRGLWTTVGVPWEVDSLRYGVRCSMEPLTMQPFGGKGARVRAPCHFHAETLALNLPETAPQHIFPCISLCSPWSNPRIYLVDTGKASLPAGEVFIQAAADTTRSLGIFFTLRDTLSALHIRHGDGQFKGHSWHDKQAVEIQSNNTNEVE